MTWQAEILCANHVKEDRESTLREIIGKAAGSEDSIAWAWNELRYGSLYGFPSICRLLWEYLRHDGMREVQLLGAWRIASPGDTTRVQLAYAVLSHRTLPMTIAAMWYSTEHHRDKNRLLCNALQRVRVNMNTRSHQSKDLYDTDEDYEDMKKILDWFTQETIVGGDEEEWGVTTYDALIKRNQAGATQLLKRSESNEHSN